MLSPSIQFLIVLSFIVPLSMSAKVLEDEKTNRLIPEGVERIQALEEIAMPKLYPSKLGQVLSRYYSEGLGGSETWDQIKSLRTKGELLDANGEIFSYESLVKKPHYLKIDIRAEEGGNYTISFDGQNAWEKLPNQTEAVRLDLQDPSARLLIHSAKYSNYLLYPLSLDKSLEYLGTKREDNSVCHWIRVQTDLGFVLDYYIDVQSYKEVKVVLRDHLNTENASIISYLDYKDVNGFPMAHEIISEKSGERVSALKIKSTEMNVGVLKWMFDLSP